MLTRIKFCGFTRRVDLDAALDLGIDAVGLVFDPHSKRALSVEAAVDLRERIPVFVSCVALFRDAGHEQVAEVLRRVSPDLLQFHGKESPAFCGQWPRPYIKAVPMGDAQDLEAWCRTFDDARALLLDSHAPGALGGSGETFDWTRAPRGLSKPWVLAGGLNPENVGRAVTMAAPNAVDVSSGIESAPGIKDADRMKAFVDAVRRADRHQAQ